MALRPKNWTDNQWGNFICGIIACLRSRQYKAPYYQDSRTLYPINVGGDPVIGIGAARVIYDGSGIATVPIFTHDVNIAYSAFSATVTFDKTRASVNRVYGGDFGNLTGDNIDMQVTFGDGKVNIIGLKPSPTEFKEPMILCLIEFRVYGEVTKSTPINLYLESTGSYLNAGTDAGQIMKNYTTMLKYVEGNLYFITPINNINGAIATELPDNTASLGDKNATGKEEPSLIKAGVAEIIPGNIGAVGLTANSNSKDKYPYNKFTCDVTIKKNDKAVIKMIGSTDEWELTFQAEVNTEGDTVLHLQGTREEAKEGVSAIGALLFEVSKEAGEYEIPVDISEQVLYNDTQPPFEVTKKDGRIYYRTDGEMPEDITNKILEEGGTIVSGDVWSSADQIAWVGYGDNIVPVYLKKGDNKIKVIVPSTNNTDSQLKIQAKGYILIPAGFKIEVIGNPESGEKVPPKQLIEKISIGDIIAFDIKTPPVPIDLDELEDLLEITDIQELELIAQYNGNQELDDTVFIGDLEEMEVQTTLQQDDTEEEVIKVLDIFESDVVVQYNGDQPIIDNISIEEVFNSEIKAITREEETLSEDIRIEDTNDLNTLTTTKQTDTTDDGTSLSDVVDTDMN